MRKTTTGRLLLMAVLLIGVFMAAATLRVLAAEVPAQDDAPPTPAAELDLSNPAMPPLETGGPSGPIIYAEESDLEVNSTSSQSAVDAPIITVWYGTNQTFGVNGDPQKWINILGNVTSASPLASLTYSLNGGPATPLTRGDDKLRLVKVGDFNIEIDYTDLTVGANTVLIKATDSNAAVSEITVNVQYVNGGNSWPAQTYTYSWQGLSSISEKAHIIDGKWVLDNGTIRPTVFDFDRLVGIGDLSWKDYTVTVPITVDAIDEPGFSGASNGPGIGIMVRWQGHYDSGDGKQPRNGWRRLGALGWYRWQKPNGTDIVSGFQLLGHGGSKLQEDSRVLELGTPYIFKLNVQSNPDPTKPANYRFKVWKAADSEPANWDLSSAGVAGEPTSGGVLLLAHHVDASFGTVTVALNSVNTAPTLTTGKTGTGGGTVSVVPNKSTFGFGEDAALTATAASGSVFAGWTGNVSDSEIAGNKANVAMFGNRQIVAVFNDPNVSTPVSDDFSACELDTSVWTFVDPLGDSSVDMTGTQLQFNIPSGASHDYWTSGADAPRVMQIAEDQDFEIVAKFDSPLSLKTQMQGLLVEQNSTNWLRFNMQHDGNTYRIFAYTAVGNSSTKRADINNLSLSAPIYLRINRTGDNWTLDYSTNGTSWTNAASFSQAFVVSKVGVYGGNKGNTPNNAPATTVLVDYFFDTANPITPEDGSAISLTVQQQGSGTVTKDPPGPTYACGEEVELTALPAAGWKFVEWTGAITGTNPVASIVMNKSETVTAVFAPDTQYILTLTTVGNGTLAADPPGPAYGLGQQVQLTATADLGHQFTGWSGDLISTTNPVTITINGNRSITGTFSTAPNRTLNTSVPGGGGSIIVDPSKTEFLNGEVAELTAVPTAGMSFVGWGGDLAGETENPYQLVMDANKNVTAQFAANVHTLTVTKDPIQGGTVTVDPVKPLYYDGETVELSVTPANGFIFLGWEGDLTGMANPASLVMTKNSNVTAKFAATAEFTLNTFADGPGEVTQDPATGPYSFGDTVTLTATADTGYAFIGWSGSLTGTENPAVITMTENAVVTGTFTLDALYSLDVTSIGNGSVTKNPVKTLYAQNEPVLLTAEPQLGYRFVGWTGGLTGTDNPATIIMTKNEAVAATFVEAEPVNLIVTADPVVGGTVTVDPFKTEYLSGEIVTLTAKSLSGYNFSGWEGDASGNTTPYQLKLDSDKNVVGTFTNQAPQVSDDFNSCEIESLWEWVDPPGSASYQMTGTQVRMVIPEGVNYDLGKGTNYAARLMQPARNTNFSAEVKLETGLSEQYQYQGILIEQDDTNYIYFQFYSDGSSVKAYAGTSVNGATSTRINQTVSVGDEMYLRVRRTDDSWKLDYSTDGTIWQKVGGTLKHEIIVQKAGIFAGSHSRNNGSQPGHVALFDYYFNSDSPISPEDPAPPSINVSVTGMGSVLRVPEKTAYACGEQVTLTATPNVGWRFVGWSGDLSGTNPQQLVTVDGLVNVNATFIPQGAGAFKTYLPTIRR